MNDTPFLAHITFAFSGMMFAVTDRITERKGVR